MVSENQKQQPAQKEFPFNKFLNTSAVYKIKDEHQKTMELARVEREQLKNRDFRQDIKLKKMTLLALLIFLGIETFGVFFVALCQGFKFKGFALEEWSFKLLVSATLAQTYLMLKVAVDYLFPKEKG